MTILTNPMEIEPASLISPPPPGWLEREAWTFMCDGQGRRDWLDEVLGVVDAPDWRFGLWLGITPTVRRFEVGVVLAELEAVGPVRSAWQPLDAVPGARYGAQAVTVPVWQGGARAGLLALHPERPDRWVSRTGDLPDMLGLDLSDLPTCSQVLDGVPLRVCQTPLDWLRHLVGAHRAWQWEVRRAWPGIVRDTIAARPADLADPGWRGLHRARQWMWFGEWRRHPAVPPEPGPRDAVCLLRPELAEAAFGGLGVELACDNPGHAKQLGDAMAAQRRKRRAAEPALPACKTFQDLRGAA
ncbi:MAG: hypothetical protein RIB84_23825 [Sneathiellaceae bacterium]